MRRFRWSMLGLFEVGFVLDAAALKLIGVLQPVLLSSVYLATAVTSLLALMTRIHLVVRGFVCTRSASRL